MKNRIEYIELSSCSENEWNVIEFFRENGLQKFYRYWGTHQWIFDAIDAITQDMLNSGKATIKNKIMTDGKITVILKQS